MSDKIIYYSPSQLETFERCSLRWWWERVGGCRAPSSASQELGTAIHAEMENWIDTGTIPPNPRAAEALRHFTEQKVERGEALVSERKFTRDLHIPSRKFTGIVDVTHMDEINPKVWDFKSSSDVKKYAKTDYQLQQNLQLNAYAFDTLDTLLPKAKTLEIAHLYIQTRGAIRSQLVKTTVERENVAKSWSGYLKIIDAVEEVRQETDPERVPHNEMACNDFGGCPHRMRCNALIFSSPTSMPVQQSDKETIGNFWEDADPKAEAEARARRLAAQAMLDAANVGVYREDDVLNPPDTTRRPAGAPPATPDTVAFEDLPKVLQKARKDEPAVPAKEKQMSGNPLAALAALAGGKPAQIESKPKTAMEGLAAKLVGAAPAPEAAPAPKTRETLDAAAETQPEGKSKGRPKGSKNKSKEVEAAEETYAQTGDVEQAAAAIEDKKVDPPAEVVTDPPPPPLEIGTLAFLLIDCVPVFGFPQGAIAFEKWVAPLLEQIQKDTGAAWQFHDFRKGTGNLVKYAARARLPQAMILQSSSDEARILMPYLIEKARCIVKGCR